MDVTAFKDRLKRNGYKLTAQRRAVLDILMKNSEKHLSTEEIYSLVRKQVPEIGLATIYRTVQIFEELEIINRLNFDDGFSRFELHTDNEEHHHHHLICEKCNKVFEVENDLLDDIEKEIDDKYNFQVKNHKVTFYGYCEKCNKSNH